MSHSRYMRYFDSKLKEDVEQFISNDTEYKSLNFTNFLHEMILIPYIQAHNELKGLIKPQEMQQWNTILQSKIIIPLIENIANKDNLNNINQHISEAIHLILNSNPKPDEAVKENILSLFPRNHLPLLHQSQIPVPPLPNQAPFGDRLHMNKQSNQNWR